jgi:hypothetical protein
VFDRCLPAVDTLRRVTVSSGTPGGQWLSAATLGLGGVAIMSVILRLVLEAGRPSDECRSVFTLAFEWLIWTAIVSAALALLVGVVALVARSDRISWTLLGMGVAVAVGVLMFVPGVATIVCGEAAA